MERIRSLEETQKPDVTMEQEMKFGDTTISTNITFLPLLNGEGKKLGSMVMIEDISSEKRMKSTMSRYMDYTMIGDGANLAARLESACKQYEASVLMSEFTYRQLNGTYRLRDIDIVVAKGKTEPVRIYEALDFHTEESFPNLREVMSTFKSGREYYEEGNWDKAERAFKEALALNPKDRLSAMYIDRCKQPKADPPEEWNGIWVLHSK